MHQSVSHIVAIALACAESAYLALAHVAVASFPKPSPPLTGAARRAVSVLIPAQDDFPGLAECLRSVCRQDYPDFEIIVGLHSSAAPARPVIERVVAEFPARRIRIVIDGRRAGANPKNCNLANIYPLCGHDIVAMIDSDVQVRPDFLACAVSELSDPAVGALTCLYTARPAGGIAAQLGALMINHWIVPSGMIDALFRGGNVCYGAAIVAHRSAIDAIGGFEAMASAVAQDHVFGEQMKRHGRQVRLASFGVETLVVEPTLRHLVRRERRWIRAVRACRPVDHVLSVVTHALPLAFLLALLPEPGALALAAVGIAATLRLSLYYAVRRRIGDAAGSALLLPLREGLTLAIWLSTFFGHSVRWGDRVLLMHGPGRMIEKEEDAR